MPEDKGILGDLLQFGVPVLIAVLVFIVLMWVVNFSKKESLKSRLHRLAPSEEEADDVIQRRRENEALGFAAVLEPFVRLVSNLDEFRRLNFFKFYRAGVDPVDAPIYYIAYRWLSLPIAAFILYILWADVGEKLTDQLIAFIGSGIVVTLTWFGPEAYIANQRAKRELILMRSFPDTLDLLLVCTEAGLALDGALARVCKELGHAYPEITEELNKTRLELTLLNDRSKALNNLADRTDLVPFRSLIASLLQTEKFGTSLTDTLRVLADEYRNTRLMLAEQKANRLPVLMTLPLITLLLPALFLIIMGPAVINIIGTTSQVDM